MENKIGINQETFSIKLQDNYFKKNDKIINESMTYKIKNWFHNILYKLKCTPEYSCRVLDEPKKEFDGWVYNLEAQTKTYRIFGIRVKTVKQKIFNL